MSTLLPQYLLTRLPLLHCDCVEVVLRLTFLVGLEGSSIISVDTLPNNFYHYFVFCCCIMCLQKQFCAEFSYINNLVFFLTFAHDSLPFSYVFTGRHSVYAYSPGNVSINSSWRILSVGEKLQRLVVTLGKIPR